MQIYNILIYYHQHIINGKEFYNSLPLKVNIHILSPYLYNIVYQ